MCARHLSAGTGSQLACTRTTLRFGTHSCRMHPATSSLSSPSSVSLDFDNVNTALAQLRPSVTTHTQVVDKPTGELMQKTWTAALSRTQYIPEHPTIRFVRVDGTVYHLGSGRLHGLTHSPHQRSPLGIVAGATHAAERYTRTGNPTELAALRASLTSALDAYRANPSCLTPGSPGRSEPKLH